MTTSPTMPLLRARNLSHEFPRPQGFWRRKSKPIRVLDGIDLDLARGECMALVGESGSGKTTLGRCLLRLIEPTEGQIYFDGEQITELTEKELRARRRYFQMIFQDPWGSLNPRMRVQEVLLEVLTAHGLPAVGERSERVEELLQEVGLPLSLASRLPHELSGGQRQRVAIARALATEPACIVADEPVSALDVSVQAEVLNLLSNLQKRLALSMLFISHDLALVEHLADRVIVLYLGRIVERAKRAAIFATPAHPYTAGLLRSAPNPDARQESFDIALAGEMPSPACPPSGCAFHPRCPIAKPKCSSEIPPLEEIREDHWAACHFPDEF